MAAHALYLSHSWMQTDASEKLSNILTVYGKSTPDFSYQFYSVSKDDPAQNLPSNKALSFAIEAKMKNCSCLIILGGVHDEYSRWINLELDIAKKLRKRVVVVEAVNSKHTSAKEKRAANHIVNWDVQNIGDALEKTVP